MQRPRATPLKLAAFFFSATVFINGGVTAGFQRDSDPPSSSSRETLQGVLLQARDALIEFANGDGNTNDEPDPTAKKVSELHEYLLFIGDLGDIEYLRNHLPKKYASQLTSPTPVPDNREAFAQLVLAIEMEESPLEHDSDLERVASQEIELGFVDDASANSDLVRSSARRGIALGEVALGAHRKGQSALAQRALDAAIQAATEKDSTAYPVFTTPSRNLDNLANYFLEQAYPEGAKEVLLRNNQLLPTLPSTSGFDWRFQAMGAIQLGDFEMASKALERVGPDEGHAEVQDALTAAKSGNIPVVQALQNAQAIVDPTIRARSLCDIAERQAAAGDKNGAAATFNLAEQAAEDIDQFQVLSLNDIAWAKIRAGDRRGAEKTLNSALLQNEMPALGTDQEDEWAILADTLAYLGHFELAHTTVLKISDRFYRGRGLGFLASRSVQAGRTQEMIAWSRGLDDPGDRCEAFLRIAEEMIAELKVPSRSETSIPYPAVFPNR